MSSKLTLSVDQEVVRKAKQFAKRQRTSVSRMVERYLELVSGRSAAGEAPPVLRRLRGSLKGARPKTYRRHVRDKYE